MGSLGVQRIFAAVFTVLFLASAAQAQPVAGVAFADSGDTALVFLGTLVALGLLLPGYCLAYAGAARVKDLVATGGQVLLATALISILWIAFGYTLAFGEGSPYLGDWSNIFLANLAEVRADTTVPESAFALFELALALIGPVILIGVGVGRARLGWMLVTVALWMLMVYVPIAHWIWGNGWLADLAVHDFAGGLVVQGAGSTAALVIAVMLRPAQTDAPASHAAALRLTGVALTWVAAIVVAGACALTSDDDAATAMLNIQIAASAGALVWSALARTSGAGLALSLAAGALCGIAATATAADYLGVGGSLVLAVITTAIAFGAHTAVRRMIDLGESGALIVAMVIGSIVGAIVFPVLMTTGLGAHFQLTEPAIRQIGVQALAALVVVIWSAVVTAIIGFGVTLALPMRIGDERDDESALA